MTRELARDILKTLGFFTVVGVFFAVVDAYPGVGIGVILTLCAGALAYLVYKAFF